MFLVKFWLNEKEALGSWSAQCILYKPPEFINHIFLECWDARLHWTVLKAIFFNIPRNPHASRYLQDRQVELVKHNIILI